MAQLQITVPVFISSKQAEFREERRKILQLMNSMPLLAPDMMENWGPASSSAQSNYLNRVRNCFLYVGFFGCKHSPPTYEEYQAARENPWREVLIYVRHCPDREPSLQSVLDEMGNLTEGHILCEYSHWDELEQMFQSHLWQAVARMLQCYRTICDAPQLRSGDDPAREEWQLNRSQIAALGLPGLDSSEACQSYASIIDSWLQAHPHLP